MTNGDEHLSAIAATRAWLRGPIADGPRPVSKLRHEAAARRIGEKAIYAAYKAEGINMSKEHITLSVVIGSRR